MPDSSRRVAYVAHCLVNQNAKVSEFAKCAGVVAPLVERLRANGYEIQQLPCPEMSYLGVARWWQSRVSTTRPATGAIADRLPVRSSTRSRSTRSTTTTW